MYYDTCVNVDNGGTPWCYTNMTNKEWDICSAASCPNFQGKFFRYITQHCFFRCIAIIAIIDEMSISSNLYNDFYFRREFIYKASSIFIALYNETNQ